MSNAALEQRILEFVLDDKSASFDELAQRVFEQQFTALPNYREHCEALGVAPTTISNWRQIPPFEPSQSTDADPATPAFRKTLLRAALPSLFDAAALWLVTSDGSASALDSFAGHAPNDSFVSRGQRIDFKALRSWLGERQRDRRPVQLLGTPSGYQNLVGVLERRSLRFRLPPGSGAFCVVPISVAANKTGDLDTTETWSTSLTASLGLDPSTCRQVICGGAFSTPLLEAPEGPNRSIRVPHWVGATMQGDALMVLDLGTIDAPSCRLLPVSARFVDERDGHDEAARDGVPRHLVLA